MAPLVSVIMPCRNAGRMLRPALLGIAAQTHPNIEIIFVNDESTDDSLATAEDFAASGVLPFRITSAATRGVSAARAHGLTLAHGDYVQWHDADDEILPDKIALQVAALEAQSDVDIADGDWMKRVQMNDMPAPEKRWRPTPVADQLRRLLSLVWYPPHMFLLRRNAADLLAAEQAWWPGRKWAEDIEYFAVAALLGLRFAHTPEAVAVYNMWSAQQTTVATDYPARALGLKEMFSRLGTFTARPEVRRRLNAEHRALLDQNWDLWAVPTGNIAQRKNGGRSVTLLNRSTGKMLDVRPREAAVVPLIETKSTARFIAHHATTATERAPTLFADQAEVIFLLERLRRAGVFMPVTPGKTSASDAG